ncbi:hypothetical protein ZYGNAAKF_CDS0131 [Enterococcus phage VRE9_2]
MKVGDTVLILKDLEDVACKGCIGVIEEINIVLNKVYFVSKEGIEMNCSFFEDELEVI